MKPDWSSIRAHYEQTGESLRAVAERFGVSSSTLFKRAAREQWKQGNAAPASRVEANGSKPAAEAPLAPENGIKVEAGNESEAPASICSAQNEEADGSNGAGASLDTFGRVS